MYAFLLYGTTPYKLVNLQSSVTYLFSGFIVVFSMMIISTLVGRDNMYIFNDFMNNLTTWLGNSWVDNIFNQSFVRAALVEESFKLFIFVQISNLIGNSNNHPITNMFYFALLGMGFGVMENVIYINKFSMEIYFLRSTFPILLHMICGLFAGYWIALGNIKTSFMDRTFFGLIFRKYPKYKKIVFIFLALITATFTHGMYNFTSGIFEGYSYPILMLLISTGITGAYFGGVHINNLYKKNLYNKPKNVTRKQNKLL